MGAIMLNDKELYDKLFFVIKCKLNIFLIYYIALGTGAPPFNCYLALRGSKTLAIRMDRSQETAGRIAELLESHPKVDKVIYPGLKSHPQYEINRK
jgi:cystathionine gamma-lyase